MIEENEAGEDTWQAPKKIWFFTPSWHIGIGKGLLIWFLIISFIPLVTVSYINYMNAFKGLTIVAEKSLVTTSKLRTENINNFFHDLSSSLDIQAELESNVEFLSSLQKDFLKSNQTIFDYVHSDRWEKITSRKRNELGKICDIQGYYNFQFINTNGDVIFSLLNTEDLGSNVYSGKYSQSLYSKTCKKVLSDGGQIFSDLEMYPPSGKKITGMIAQPMLDKEGNKIGLIVIQITMDQLNRITQDEVGLGETGVSYVIGEDLMLRSLTRFNDGSMILHVKIKNDATRRWVESRQQLLYGQDIKNERYLDGKVSTYPNNKNVWVYGIFRNISALDKLGVHWAVFEEIDQTEAFAYTREFVKTVKFSLVIIFLIVFVISIIVTKRFVDPLKELSAWAKQVARGELIKKDIRAPHNEVGEMKDSFNKMVNSYSAMADVSKEIAIGDFSKKVQVRSKYDELAQSMNQMIDSFRDVVAQSNAIAKGDYSTSITPRSPKDTLGISLYEMTKTLRDTSEKIYNQDWLKTGLSELNERMSGKKDLSELANEIISYLVRYSGGQLGLLYLLNDKQTLDLYANYALTDPLKKFAQFKMGEGLVGQVAVQQLPVEFENIAEDAPALNYGVDEKIPNYFLITPFVYENNLVGIIQIGSMSKFPEINKTFINMCLESIGVAVNSAKAHTTLQQLYLQTQEQKERLQVQQEELRQTNEELEEQTKALKVSEETLQSQKEELSVINEELEERTKALEKEKDNIKIKNAELEQAHVEIEKKAKDVEQASRYKSEFLANMSHELRTPLNSILVLSQLLAENSHKNLSDKQIEFANTINSSGSDLLALINEVLDLSKVEAGKLELNIEKVPFDQFKMQIESTFKPVIINKGLKLIIDIHNDLPDGITTDPQRVFQIIKNLISNSLKFTEKGSIQFTISRISSQIKLARPNLNPENSVAFIVTDTGIGIASDKLMLIFEAFQQADGTTSRKYGGTGLGLSISKNLADVLGGEIQVESKEGEGTTFTLILPEKFTPPPKDSTELPAKKTEKHLYPVDEFNTQEQVQPVQKEEIAITEPAVMDDRSTIRKGDKTLLIIEDDANFSKILFDLAHEKDFKCLVASDGETGLHYASIYKPNAIILDIGLPGIDGWEVMETLKANSETRHIPVHFISASDKNMKAMKMGAIGYLTKPVSLEKLNKAFKKIEDIISKSVKRLLVIDDEAIIRKSIVELVGSGDVETTAVENGKDALALLKNSGFDCVILDLGLKDMSGFDLLEQIRKEEALIDLPIIVYTGQELTREQEEVLQKHADSIIIKGVRSPERLLAETTLFLHRVEANMPEKKRRMLQMVHDKDAVFKDKKILIVDDDMRNVFAISSVLETKGIKVIVGKNGKDGIKKLEDNPDVDLVLMDIMMPEMDGYEAMRFIRKDAKNYKLPIIALTAKAMKDDREKAIAAGANDYMTKPFETTKLVSLLRVWLYR